MEDIRFYCINLRRRTDRLRNFIDNFPLKYIDKLQIVGAVDASSHQLSTEDLAKLKNADWDIQKGKGQWGCSFSHESVWRHMLENKIPYAVILEDDAVFNKNEDFEEFLKMFRLLDLRACFLGPANHPENTKSCPHSFDELICPGICRLKSNLGSMSYFISLDGIRDLICIVDTKGHYRAVDQLINDYMKLRNQWFCISPPCFSVADLGSDIPTVT
jgi:GR25 family glycosyltransferase involved in LPS biosynthesis